MEGTVIKSTGSSYIVKTTDNNIYECKLKGKYKIHEIKNTNPLAVGDIVIFEMFDSNNCGLIKQIRKRKNYIIRKSTNLSKQSHIIAANIDQAILIATISNPRTSTGFIDRFLVTAEAFYIPAIIVFNKIDLYDDKSNNLLNKFVDVYENIGYKCLKVSADKNINLDELNLLLQNKTSLISGHSGVGKSTLINKIEPRLNIKIAEISSYHLKGIHTTTFAEMHSLSFGGSIIDTPGIKEFGLFDFKKEELEGYFPEMFKLSDECQFANCTHVHEPKCAVKKALEEGKIHQSRYTNYINMYNNQLEDESQEYL